MDKIIKAAVWNGDMLVTVLNTTKMVNTAIDIHKLSPVAAAALGRTLTAATYMCANLKNQTDSLSVSIKGDGAGGGISVSGNAKLMMRGCVDNPNVFLAPNKWGKLDVAKFVGNGSLTVVKDLGLKTPFSGTVELVSGEIAQDFAYYFMQSEQTPTAIALGVKIDKDLTCKSAGGIVLSPLPGCSEQSLQRAEELLLEFTNISTLLEDSTPEQIFSKYFGDAKCQIMYPEYKCTCNLDYIKKIIITLGEKEAFDIVREQGKLSLFCHYCATDYVFTQSDLTKLFKESNEA